MYAGTSTKKNDHFETVAFKSFFGDHARKLKISSIKGVTGTAFIIHTYIHICTISIPGEDIQYIHKYIQFNAHNISL